MSNTDTGPQSLVAVADYFLGVHDDLLDPDEDFGDDFSEADALEIIRRNYTSGTCQAFAIALHDHLGLPLVNLMGGLHVAVQCPDGQLMDFMGVTDLDTMAKRYGWRKGKTTVTPRSRDDILGQLGGEDDQADEPWSDLNLDKWVLAKLDRWAVPAASMVESPVGNELAKSKRRPRH